MDALDENEAAHSPLASYSKHHDCRYQDGLNNPSKTLIVAYMYR